MSKEVSITDYIPENIEAKVNNIFYNLNLLDYDLVPISEICDKFGIAIDYKEFKNNVSCSLSINDNHLKKYETNKVIFLNIRKNIYPRFDIAYMLGKYIYDYKNQEKYTSHKYCNKDDISIIDRTCNLFALYMTMPENIFMSKYEELQELYGNNIYMTSKMVEYFLVPTNKLIERATMLYKTIEKKDGKVIKLKKI